MARKSLSDQVIEEIDRTRGLLRPVQDITDPMTSHIIGAALESLHKVETMCLAAKQRQVNDALSETPLAIAFQGDALSQATARKRSTTHKATTRRKVAES